MCIQSLQQTNTCLFFQSGILLFPLHTAFSPSRLVTVSAMLPPPLRKLCWGRLGGTVIKPLPLAQGVIPAFWDRAPHQAPLLGACFLLSHSPCLCSLSRWLSLSSKWIKSFLKKRKKNFADTIKSYVYTFMPVLWYWNILKNHFFLFSIILKFS